MNRVVASAAMVALLAGCDDPLSDVARIGDVDLAEGETAAAAIASAAETAAAPGFLTRVLQGAIPAQQDGIGDPGAPGIASVQEAAQDGSETARTEAAGTGAGFWAALGFGPRGDVAVDEPASGAVTLAALSSDTMAAEDAAGPDVPAPEDAGPDDTAAQTPAAGEAPQQAPRRLSLFGPRVSAPTGPDAFSVAAGTVLPYGQIATVCGLPDSALGVAVGQAAGYVVHDTAASSVAQRTHYITGFPDGCARQFTAALALFGDVGTHEVVRYTSDAAARPYSATDTAYEQVKADVCRVGVGEPCGTALDRLARRTVFITVYETFGTNPTWGDILLHEGQVLAVNFN